jgi:putative transposase
MPRRPRLDLPGIPQHVIQRGNDRQPCFFVVDDYTRYYDAMREIAVQERCAIHAYVLMSNHVHLLITPAVAGSVSRFMQALGGRYVRYVNLRHDRTGTLWEGRFKSCLVGDERYLLQCYRYIELNPVRAGMVADPADYRWSSHRCNALGKRDVLVTPHPTYMALGSDARRRERAFRALVMEAVDADETEAIRRHVQRQHAYGSDSFRRAVETQIGRSIGPRKIGRPRRTSRRDASLDAESRL